MTLQGFGVTLNAPLNLTLAVIAAILGVGAGRAWGYRAGVANVISEVQHALDRAARDIRIFMEAGAGAAFGPFAQRALKEAEYLVRWRTAPNNINAKPQGISRLNPPTVPRSRAARKELERENQRTLIFALGRQNQRPDDTYAGPLSNVMTARYTIPDRTPKEAADADA